MEYDSSIPGAEGCELKFLVLVRGVIGQVEFVMMKNKNRSLVLIGLAIVAGLVGVFAWTSYGQFGRSKYTSPQANVAATIAGDPINIEYYAPSMHGRKIMGGLVPF